MEVWTFTPPITHRPPKTSPYLSPHAVVFSLFSSSKIRLILLLLLLLHCTKRHIILYAHVRLQTSGKLKEKIFVRVTSEILVRNCAYIYANVYIINRIETDFFKSYNFYINKKQTNPFCIVIIINISVTSNNTLLKNGQ